jgi:hypothetical protein
MNTQCIIENVIKNYENNIMRIHDMHDLPLHPYLLMKEMTFQSHTPTAVVSKLDRTVTSQRSEITCGEVFKVFNSALYKSL